MATANHMSVSSGVARLACPDAGSHPAPGLSVKVEKFSLWWSAAQSGMFHRRTLRVLLYRGFLEEERKADPCLG
jgi:hypothetical protein